VFLRLLVTQDAAIVVVEELGPPAGSDAGEERQDRWTAWLDQLEPPTLSDDLQTAYPVPSQRSAGIRGNPDYPDFPMKTTVSWQFEPTPPPEVRSWTIDGHWKVERSEA
jgi:hypothetical protein